MLLHRLAPRCRKSPVQSITKSITRNCLARGASRFDDRFCLVNAASESDDAGIFIRCQPSLPHLATLSAVAHYGRRWRRDVRIAAKADALIAIHSARADFRRLEFQTPFTRGDPVNTKSLKAFAWMGAGVGAAVLLVKVLRRPEIKRALGDFFDAACTKVDKQVGWSTQIGR